MRVDERIDNGIERVEHVLTAAPVTLESIDARLASLEATVGPFIDRVSAMLDAFEEFSNGPMGKMMLRKAGKDAT